MKAELKINDKKEVVVTTTTDFQKSVEPEVGFVYRRKSVRDFSYNFLIKLNESVTKETYTYFKILVYSFMTDKWEDQGETVGTHDLKNYYVRVLGDVSELVESSHRALNGDLSVMPQLEEDDLPQEPGLVSRNVQSEALVGVVDKLSVLKNRSEELTYMANCIIESQKNSLMQTVIKMEGMVREFRSRIEKVMKVISMIELYLGVNEELMQISEGEKADPSEPLTLRQLVLYMDEETALTGYKCGGYSYEDIEKFDEWLLNPKNRDLVIPEKRSIVVFKPRRKDKHYSDDFYSHTVRHQWTHVSYLLMRNRDNLYRVFSTNFSVSDTVFPRKAELEKLMKNQDEGRDISMEVDNLQTRGMKFAMFVNGLFDRSDIMYPIDGKVDMFKMDESPIRIVYDAEPSLTSGHKSWWEFIKEVNSSVGEGSRIYLPMRKRITKENMYYRLVKFYSSEYSIPKGPSKGMYQVEKYAFPNDPGKQSLCIKYNPGGEYWDDLSGWKQRKNRITYLLDEDDLNYGGVINYDNVTFEEIDYYLKSRVDRSNYLEMFRPLIGLRDELLKDIEKEKDFVKMVEGETGKSESEVWEALRWWKLKNKWKRSLTSDDSKAYRMIVRKLTKDVSRETL